MSLWNLESTQEHRMFQVLQEEALDATPDRILRGLRVPDIRVAGLVVRETGQEVVGTSILDAPPAALQIGPKYPSPFKAPRREGVGELFYISVYCCRGDPGGAYCGLMASGLPVAPGMAACSDHWDFGTRLLIADRYLVTCLDRGSAVTEPNHLDIHFYDCGNQQDPAPGTGWAWLQGVGTRVMVEVLGD